jgi:aspartokinase
MRSFHFCTAKRDEDKVDAFIEEQRGLQTNLRLIKEPDVAIFGIYGPHFREKHSIAANLFYLLGQAGINILGVSSSISSVCCIISAQNVDQARQLVGSHYELP